MTVYFLDSSALIKRYLSEVGTNWVRGIVATRPGNIIFVAQITPIEVVSGVARRKRENAITTRTAHAIRLILDRHTRREYKVLELSEQIMQRAKDILENYPLRAYDAIQLSSALESQTQLTKFGLGSLVFVCADTRLLSVATAEGLTTDDPSAHP